MFLSYPTLSKQIDKFLTKSIKQEVQFTAYGFFAIDNSTLFKVSQGIIIYEYNKY